MYGSNSRNAGIVPSWAELGPKPQPLFSRRKPPAGWFGWIASVVIFATMISYLQSVLPPTLNNTVRIAGATHIAEAAPDSAQPRMKRREGGAPCAAGNPDGDEYNMRLHVGALFIILAVSSAACGFPLLAARFPILRIPGKFFFAVRHFGTGVLLATAFVHLLPTAFISLGNPCLSEFWTSDYPAMPGAIALGGIFLVATMEMVFSPARQFTPDKRSHKTDDGHVEAQTKVGSVPSDRGRTGGLCGGGNAEVAMTITRAPAPAMVRASTEPARRTAAGQAGTQVMPHEEPVSPPHVLTPEQQHKKDILQCMMLEVGILFHSVFIGMALSVAVGGNFVVLLIAIAFHQTFEGLALGARIASISWPERTWQPWLMVVAYGCTTPIGQALGLATHTLYNPGSEFGLILVGTMNAVSSGLLVFAALIELLAEDFLSDHSWVIMRGRKRVIACLLVLLGAILMSLVGAWA